MVFLSFLFFSLELYQFYFRSILRPNPRSDWKFQSILNIQKSTSKKKKIGAHFMNSIQNFHW